MASMAAALLRLASSISHIGFSFFFSEYACFSISFTMNKPCGLILAPGVFASAGLRKLLGIPVVFLTSCPDLLSGQSKFQCPKLLHLLHL